MKFGITLSNRGVLVGLHEGHGRGHLHRALLEATAYAVRHNLEVMREVPRHLFAPGHA